LRIERRQFGLGGIGADDGEAVEKGLVDEPPLGRVGGEVGEATLVYWAQRVVESLRDILDLPDGGGRSVASLGALGLDAVLLGLQHLFGDVALVKELDELLLLAGELPESAAVAADSRRATSALASTYAWSASQMASC
jgi:hypothetical protein